MNWFLDDFCYCMSECDHTECFRHHSHSGPGIHTMGLLKDTEYCPLEKGEANDKNRNKRNRNNGINN